MTTRCAPRRPKRSATAALSCPIRPIPVTPTCRATSCSATWRWLTRPCTRCLSLDTIMAGLACGEVSLLAWTIVQPGIDHFMSLPDAATMEAMRLLADAPAGDAPVVAGDSGAVGLAGLWGVLGDPDLARHLSLGPASRALVFNYE